MTAFAAIRRGPVHGRYVGVGHCRVAISEAVMSSFYIMPSGLRTTLPPLFANMPTQ